MSNVHVSSRPAVLPWRDLDSLRRVLPDLHSLLADRQRDGLGELRARADWLRDLARDGMSETVAVEVCALAARAVAEVRGVHLHDEQLLAGLGLASGCAVQLLTGEGKTFAAVAPALVHALAGRRVHVVSANAYLAERDSSWAGDVLRALGCRVGVTLPGCPRAEARVGYQAEVTYGAAQDFGFDFLRDHLFLPGDEPVQVCRDVAIVDEADAVLLDLARTPLVLSGAAPARTEALIRADQVVRRLGRADLDVDLARQRVELADPGIAKVEAILGLDNLYELAPIDWPGLVRTALRAHVLLARDRDYVVGADGIGVVDELTGRVAPGRRWAEGLHQAVEAKEGVAPTRERRAAGRITVGGYFRSYQHLAGMSGTLEGAEAELAQVYGLSTLVIGPHRPVRRIDQPDVVYPSEAERRAGIADDIERRHHAGQPVLAGTTSIAQSHALSEALAARSVPHRVLNARNDHEEAEIIAGAGRWGAVTVATQMAGRGVDIMLGGQDGRPEDHARVTAVGGLMVWGVEHHPARRLDAQLRGRAGRQGDPGESRFAVCPTDALAELASGPSQSTPEAVRSGQARAEELDQELRAFSRAAESVVDAMHERLYDRRRQAQDDRTVQTWLPEAFDLAAEALARGRLYLPSPPALPRWRRRKAARARIGELIAERVSSVGADRLHQVAALLVRHLMVTLWSDALDTFDGLEAMGQAAPGASPESPRWHAAAVAAYRDFERRLFTAWVEQVLAFRVTTEGMAGIEGREPAAEILRVGPAMTAQADDAEEMPEIHEWTGWSYNRFVRRHWGIVLPDPPVVLVVEAIGDTATSADITLSIDVEDPARTTVRVRMP